MSSPSSPSPAEPREGYEHFDRDTLAIVLSHFDLGYISKLMDFDRGSRKAPKLLLVTGKGNFLLKRRARGKDDPFKVAFSHALQLYLASKEFPLPALMGTKQENNSLLQLDSGVYEVFEFVRGHPYSQNLEETYDAGRTLGKYHLLVRNYQPEFEPPYGSYHDSKHVRTALRQIPQNFGHNLGKLTETEFESVTRYLSATYDACARKTNELGFPNWEIQIVHSDWHPGNMMFRDSKVVAVIDYDAARLQPRVTDLANGILQFSMVGGGDDAMEWPEYCDEGRIKRFVRGYDSVNVISLAELAAVPYLMVEALIAEAAFPIAAHGKFGKIHGAHFLIMVQRKVQWLLGEAPRLIQELGQD
jgi:Ser/Thr protein kinase RdoA (MazF antagonist)